MKTDPVLLAVGLLILANVTTARELAEVSRRRDVEEDDPLSASSLRKRALDMMIEKLASGGR